MILVKNLQIILIFKAKKASGQSDAFLLFVLTIDHILASKH